MRTIKNCRVIKNMVALGCNSPRIISGKCEGYNTKYYSPDGHHYSCDKCRYNIKNKD